MNLQQLIDEKIALGKRLIEENEGLQYMTFHIQNIEPTDLQEYAKEINEEVKQCSNRLQVFPTTPHGVSVFLYSKPVKINTQISYELI